MFLFFVLTTLSLLSNVFSLKCYLCASGDKYADIQNMILEATAIEVPKCHDKVPHECNKEQKDMKCITMASDVGTDSDELKSCYSPFYQQMIDDLPSSKKCEEMESRESSHCKVCDNDLCNSSKALSGAMSVIAAAFLITILLPVLFS